MIARGAIRSNKPPSEDGIVTGPKWLNLSLHSRREPVILALLTGMAIVMFAAVGGLSRLYHAQQAALAERWAERGSADLQAKRFGAAVADYRAAMQYQRDSDRNQLSLAEALLGQKKTDEASVYLANLWDREPENGVVNLDLARIAAGKGDTAKALRFYHDAIYATWTGDQEKASRTVRLELIAYLLGIGARTQAQAELLALEANLPEDSPEQDRVGALFLDAQDAQHALSAFKLAAAHQPKDAAALAGAGSAAFAMGMYPAAQRYLTQALALAPGDSRSAQLLHKTNAVLSFDLYRQVSSAERDRIATNAFSVAGARLKTCAQHGAAQAAWQDLDQQWNRLKPQISARELRRNADLVNAVMGLAAQIETRTAGVCGPPSEDDTALLLAVRNHEEN